jgi:hypothetical protein
MHKRTKSRLVYRNRRNRRNNKQAYRIAAKNLGGNYGKERWRENQAR